MPLQSSTLALSAFPVIETRNFEVMRHSMLNHFGATKFDISPSAAGFYAKSDSVRSGPISLGYCAYAGRASVEFPETDFVRMQIPLAGHARTIVGGEQSDLDIAHYYVTSADRASRLEFGSDFQQLFLRVEREALQDKLTALLGFRPKGRLSFAPVLDIDKVKLGTLMSLIGFTAGHLASTSGLPEPPVLMTRELQETLVVAFLESVPHTFSDLLRGEPLDIAPAQVRAVEEYIDGNWMRPLTAEHLAEVTGLGARSLFRSFRRYRAHTPLQYVKMVRLNHANLLLRSPSEDTSVTGVAFRCGFSNPGHFAKDYQDRFGELPSVTLAKGK